MPTKPWAPGRFIPGALCSVILFSLFVLGSHPASANLFNSPWDKLAHASIFATLAFSLKWLWPKLNTLLVLLLIGLIGGADELHQFLVPMRQPGWEDLLADLVGATLGVGVWQLKCYGQRQKNDKNLIN